MRIIAYNYDFEKPVLLHVDRLSQIKNITAGFFRDDGHLVLQSAKPYSSNVVAYVIPIGDMPQSLDEAMTARSIEIKKNIDMREFLGEGIGKEMIRQPDSVLWAMGLDPEIY